MPLLLLAVTALLVLVWVYVSYRKNKPITEKKTEFLEGEPKKIAATLVQFLTQQKLLKTDSTETEEKRES